MRCYPALLMALVLVPALYPQGKLAEAEASFNYSMEDPGFPWIRIDPSLMGLDGSTALVNKRDELTFLILAENTGIEADVTNEDLVELAQAHIKGLSYHTRFTDTKPETIDGVEGLRFSVRAVVDDIVWSYSYWVGSHNGISYRFVNWKADGLLDYIEEVGQKLASGFHILDRDLVVHNEFIGPVEPFESIELDLKFDLTGLDWNKWVEVENEVHGAVFGATLNAGTEMVFVPMLHSGLSPSWTDLRTVFLEQLYGLDSETLHFQGEKMVESGGSPAFEFAFSRILEGSKWHDLIRIHKFDGFSVGVASLSSSDDPLLRSRIITAMNRLAVGPNSDLGQFRSAMAPPQKSFSSRITNALGLRQFNRANYALARRYFEASYRLNDSDTVVLNNILTTLGYLQDYSAGVELYKEYELAFESDPVLLAGYAFCLQMENRISEAGGAYRRAFAMDLQHADYFQSYLEMLAGQEKFDAAISAARDYAERFDDWKARGWLGMMYSRSGDYEKAIEIYQELDKQRPFDPQIDYELSSIYMASEEYGMALETLEAIGGEIYDHAEYLALKGQAQLALNSYMEARGTFEKALELNPSNAEVRNLLELTTSALGKGDASVSKTTIAPVELPDGIWDRVNAAQQGEKTSVETVVDYSIYACSSKEGATYRNTQYFKATLLDQSSVDLFSTLVFDFDPFNQQIFVNELKVLDENGDTVANGDPSDYYVLHRPDPSGIVSQRKALHVPVPGLKKGYSLRYAVTWESSLFEETFPFLRYYFSFARPATIAVLAVENKGGSLMFEADESLVEERIGSVRYWYGEGLPRSKNEPLASDPESFLPWVAVSEKEKDWPAVAASYRKMIRDRLRIEGPVKTLAKEIGSGSKSDQEKVRAVREYVQKNYTYKALEFGRRAMVPNKSSQIILNKYGDCKDLALLTSQLLEELGVESRLALVNTRFELRPGMPSMDQFDHMILYLPKAYGGRFVDCTAKYASAEFSGPVGLGGKEALVLDWKKPELIKIPEASEQESLIELDRIARLNEKGIQVEETIAFMGPQGALMRQYFASMDPERIEEYVQQFYAQYEKDVRVNSVELESLDDLRKAFRVTVDYDLMRNVSKIESGMQLNSLPGVWERYYFEVPYLRERLTPMTIKSPVTISATTRLQGSVRPTALSLGGLNHSSSTEYHSFKYTAASDASNPLMLTSEIRVFAGDYPKEEYPKFYDSGLEATRPLSNPLMFHNN